ncbi:MAG: ribonucleoside-diphosphate reductase, adenosylcobalamin-dependent, partial [Nitrospirae bacterium RBG_16_64_22]
MTLSESALRVLERRYLRRDEAGRVIETPEEMVRRVARAAARAERRFGLKRRSARKIEDRFFDLLNGLLFLPNSPALMNAGRPKGQLAACFVLPVEDSMDKIFDTVKHAAIIHQSGGGTGFSFSRLRPRDDRVATTGGKASGPVSFMRVFNTATEVIKQGGMRRGANMAVLRVDHPDIFEFIRAKRDPEAFTAFNLSVGVTDRFLRALRKNGGIGLVNPRTGRAVRTVRAREVWDTVVQSAWQSGEPGVLFLDRINAANPTPALGEIEATNPCGEQPLLPYEACVLGSVNLALMIAEGKKPGVDWRRLAESVSLAVRFLDDVVEVNHYPLPEIARTTRAGRKVGLGVMGWADLLIRLGIPYDAPEAIRLGGRVMRFIRLHAYKASEALARERGAFPNLRHSRFASKGPRLRNATLTTIAPTGTLSLIAACSSGIEPIFAPVYQREAAGLELREIHPLFRLAAEKSGLASDDFFHEAGKRGTVRGIAGVPEEMKHLFRTAHEIAPADHVRMQAAFQKYTDNAVSKTVNLPESATPADVEEVFLLAHRLACKGVTVYRYGTRPQPIRREEEPEVP